MLHRTFQIFEDTFYCGYMCFFGAWLEPSNQTSVVESEMEDCFVINHETKQFPKKNATLLVFLQSSTPPAQSASLMLLK